MRPRALLAAAVTLAFPPVAAGAQALSCAVPAAIEPPHPDLPTVQQPRRLLPTAGYTLAVSWSPQYCAAGGAGRGAASSFQCGGANRFGWVLHGLWPDGPGAEWPQYCRAVPLLDEATLRRNLCATPSVQLLQHEWAKHGSCMSGGADAYFARSTGLYRALRFPDMAALARIPSLTAGAVAAAMARMNPGLAPDRLRVTVARDGGLDELWLCLDLRFRSVRCPAHQGGAAASTPVRIRL